MTTNTHPVKVSGPLTPQQEAAAHTLKAIMVSRNGVQAEQTVVRCHRDEARVDKIGIVFDDKMGRWLVELWCQKHKKEDAAYSHFYLTIKITKRAILVTRPLADVPSLGDAVAVFKAEAAEAFEMMKQDPDYSRLRSQGLDEYLNPAQGKQARPEKPSSGQAALF